MEHPGFFARGGPYSLGEIAQAIGADLPLASCSAVEISDVRRLKDAQASHLTFLDNRKYVSELAATSASACVLAEDDAHLAPGATAVLTAHSPYRAFAQVLNLFYPEAMQTKAAGSAAGDGGRLVHPSAQISEKATIEPGAVIGREAVIGPGTTIAATAVIGYRTVVGADSYVGAGATVTHSIVGNRVVIHSGVRMGQDGFGFAMGPEGHLKVPQIGRVIVHDDVEIGANCTVDRGSLGDTVIGQGTKIDNLVQIAHNVVIGRHCVIVAQSGIAGSAELGDFVVMGAKSGVLGHLKIGSGAQIAGMAHVKDDVGPGERMGGTPARPFAEWARELAAIRRLSRKGKSG